MSKVPPEIFRAYDIRGIVDRTLTPEVVRWIGRALGTMAFEQAGSPSQARAGAFAGGGANAPAFARGGANAPAFAGGNANAPAFVGGNANAPAFAGGGANAPAFVGGGANAPAFVGGNANAPAFALGRDGRLSGPSLLDALAEGILAAGADVIDIGAVPTPLSYFAAAHLGCGSCVSVTGSHNPPDYNGLKMVIAGETLYGDRVQEVRSRIESGSLRSGTGRRRKADVVDAYIERIAGDVRLARPFRIAIDCGNGIAGAVAPRLFRRLGCEVTELFCEVDGRFPNHHPDPSQPENLRDLEAVLARGAHDLGIAFDGDGDRLGVVAKTGEVIYADRQMMLYAKDVLSREPGATIIYDVKSTRLLGPWIERHGGKPLIWKTGHSLIKAKLKETGAALAGEMSGHTFFRERWYGFDDALYTGARLLEILAREPDATLALTSLPNAPSTPELHWTLAEGEPHVLIERLQASHPFEDAERVITIDGMRVEYADGFGLARASNTTPVIVLRFEADDGRALARIQASFRAALQPLKPGAPLPF